MTKLRKSDVHSVSNSTKGFGYVCNCCCCCCGILRGITDWGTKNSVAYANYYSVINADECLGCGMCIDRCQVHVISEQNGVIVVDLKRCRALRNNQQKQRARAPQKEGKKAYL